MKSMSLSTIDRNLRRFQDGIPLKENLGKEDPKCSHGPKCVCVLRLNNL